MVVGSMDVIDVVLQRGDLVPVWDRNNRKGLAAVSKAMNRRVRRGVEIWYAAVAYIYPWTDIHFMPQYIRRCHVTGDAESVVVPSL